MMTEKRKLLYACKNVSTDMHICAKFTVRWEMQHIATCVSEAKPCCIACITLPIKYNHAMI